MFGKFIIMFFAILLHITSCSSLERFTVKDVDNSNQQQTIIDEFQDGYDGMNEKSVNDIIEDY